MVDQSRLKRLPRKSSRKIRIEINPRPLFLFLIRPCSIPTRVGSEISRECLQKNNVFVAVILPQKRKFHISMIFSRKYENKHFRASSNTSHHHHTALYYLN